ncbi:MAG TPA: biotin--[acetyl-CoA-carboxylase] ligase [Candidatus Nitrosocosmicus sp.]|nr:biotin--[acetyl-CoA-carboxylase] ligase [Candidatus Nitrosocosmicus sp.]
MIPVIKIQCSNKQKVEFLSNIINKFPEQLIFQNFYFFDSLSSTQDFANMLSKNFDTTYPLVVLTDFQTGGRGRRGANWASPKGGVWMSMVFKSELDSSELFSMLILTVFILSEAIHSQLDVNLQIKWPNDLLIEGKKVAGILMDTEIETGKLSKVTIGIGVNSNNDLEMTKNQVLDKSNIHYGITTLKSTNDNQEVSNFELVSFMLYNFSKLVPKLISKLFRDELRQWYKRKIEESSTTLSYKFRIKNNEFTGEIILVNDDGSILVRNMEQPLDNNFIRINSVFESSLG